MYYLEPTRGAMSIWFEFAAILTRGCRKLENHVFEPMSFAIDGAGSLYVSDYFSPHPYKAAADGTISVLTNTTLSSPYLYLFAATLMAVICS